MPGVRCAVLGDPIGHSLSPVLHRTAYAGLGLDWAFDPIRVPAGGLAAFVDGLGVDGLGVDGLGVDGAQEWRGLALTMPLKREAPPLLDSWDDWVELTGVANTVVLGQGRRHGLNTDVSGARACLGAYDAAPRRAVVLGGGATATSLLMALAECGLAEAVLVVRDAARARPTLDAVARHPSPPAVEVRTFDAVPPAVPAVDVLVSTVPATAQAPELVAAFADVPLVFDVVYHPWPTPLAAAAAVHGQGLITGLDLLVAQAVDQVVAMTGRDGVPVTAMRAAAERALAARSPG